MVFCTPVWTLNVVTPANLGVPARLTGRSRANTMTAMPTAQANGIEIVYDTFGDAADPTVLLVMGLGPRWSTGRPSSARASPTAASTSCGTTTATWASRPVSTPSTSALLAARSAGETPDVPYLLGDMAADAVGVLDHLGIDTAHLFGVSMGGMIVQTLAIEHPDRRHPHVGDVDHRRPRRGNPTGEAMALLMSPPARSREELQDAALRGATVAAAPACTTRTSCGPPPPRPGTVATTRRAPPVNWRRSWPRAAGPQHSPRWASRRSSSTAPPTP